MSKFQFITLLVLGFVIQVLAWTAFAFAMINSYTNAVQYLAGTLQADSNGWFNTFLIGTMFAVWHCLKSVKVEFSNR